MVGLVQRVRAQVQTRAVDVSNDQTETFFKGLLADGSGHDRLVLLDKVDLLAGGVNLFRLELFVACFHQQFLAGCSGLALGLGGVQEGLVALGKGSGLCLDIRVLVGGILRLIKQLFGCLLCGKRFAHVRLSPLSFPRKCADTQHSRK